MAYSPNVLARARARLAQAKSDHEAEYARNRAAAFAEYPRLEEIERQLRTTAAQAIAVSFRRGEDPAQAIAQLKEENLALQREREWILSSFDEGFLDPFPICPDCGGSGYVGSQMCTCLRELCRQEQKKELTFLFGAGNERFEHFRLDVYPDEYMAEFGCSARQMMRLVLGKCQRYARGFSADSGSMLFTGAPGLGKTFLSACIARTVAGNGFSVVYNTATALFSDFETAKFGTVSEEKRALTDKYLMCDLLIMDDLGTEMTTQFTVSALYTVVNTRLMENRPTIISTNLTPEDIRGRYSAPIASRILGMYQLMQFLGSDIRLQHPAAAKK